MKTITITMTIIITLITITWERKNTWKKKWLNSVTKLFRWTAGSPYDFFTYCWEVQLRMYIWNEICYHSDARKTAYSNITDSRFIENECPNTMKGRLEKWRMAKVKKKSTEKRTSNRNRPTQDWGGLGYLDSQNAKDQEKDGGDQNCVSDRLEGVK